MWVSFIKCLAWCYQLGDISSWVSELTWPTWLTMQPQFVDIGYLSFGRNWKYIFCIQLTKIFCFHRAPVGSQSEQGCSCKLLLGKCEVNKINTKFYVNRKHWPSLLGSLCPPFNINSCILCLCFIWCHDVYNPLSAFCSSCPTTDQIIIHRAQTFYLTSESNVLSSVC